MKTGNEANEFAKSGKHLPQCLRDFHDAKDVFKCIGGMYPVGDQTTKQNPPIVGWTDGMCYVLDVFLHFMAQHGYTLQRSRRPIQFYNLGDTIGQRRAKEVEAFKTMLADAKRDAKAPAVTP